MRKCSHPDTLHCQDCSPGFQYAKITAPMDTMLEAHKHGYDCGFEDGFAEAVRMLRDRQCPQILGKGECDCMISSDKWLEENKNDPKGS